MVDLIIFQIQRLHTDGRQFTVPSSGFMMNWRWIPLFNPHVHGHPSQDLWWIRFYDTMKMIHMVVNVLIGFQHHEMDDHAPVDISRHQSTMFHCHLGYQVEIFIAVRTGKSWKQPSYYWTIPLITGKWYHFQPFPLCESSVFFENNHFPWRLVTNYQRVPWRVIKHTTCKSTIFRRFSQLPPAFIDDFPIEQLKNIHFTEDFPIKQINFCRFFFQPGWLQAPQIRCLHWRCGSDVPVGMTLGTLRGDRGGVSLWETNMAMVNFPKKIGKHR